MNGKVAFPNLEEKIGKYQLRTCCVSMILFIIFRSCMRMFRSSFLGAPWKERLVSGVDVFRLLAFNGLKILILHSIIIANKVMVMISYMKDVVWNLISYIEDLPIRVFAIKE